MMDTSTERSPAQLLAGMRESIHEFNNTLTPILANAQLVQMMLESPSQDVQDAMGDIVEAAKRARELVQEIRGAAKELQEIVDPDEASSEGAGIRHG